MKKIALYNPRVENNKLILSWSPESLFADSSFWIEYVNLPAINASPQALLEAYLPVCLAFCALGEVEISFPYHFDDNVLASWKKVFRDTAQELFRKPYEAKFLNPPGNKELSAGDAGTETALLFGGGSEALLTLAYLMEEGISPYLVSIWGSHWPGSEWESNRDRRDLEDKLSEEFGFRMFRIRTNFRDLFAGRNFSVLLAHKGDLFISCLFLPFNLSLLFPVAPQLALKRIVSGNEKESSCDRWFYSLSTEMTLNLRSCSHRVRYSSYLEDLSKNEVVKKLHQQYPEIGKFQCSCWRAKGQRWCLRCEKCLRIFSILKINGIDPSVVAIDETRLWRNLDKELSAEIGWEIVRNVAVRREWETIRAEAIRGGNAPEICDMISLFYRRFVLRRAYFSITRFAGVLAAKEKC